MPASTNSYSEFIEQQSRRAIEEHQRRMLEESIFLGRLQSQTIPTSAPPPQLQVTTRTTDWWMNSSIPSFIVDDANEPSPVQYKYPIGTILVYTDSAVDYFRSRKIPTPMFKITEWKSATETKKILWAGKAEEEDGNIGLNNIRLADDVEIETFNTLYKKLRICQELPAIGSVVEYIGKTDDYWHKKAIVQQYSKNHQISISFIGTSGLRNYPFNVWRISKSQELGFQPNPEDYFECSCCNSQRKRNIYKKIGNYLFCDEYCAMEAGYNYCRECGSWQVASSLSMTIDGHTCESCYITNYRECYSCNTMIRTSRMSIEEGTNNHHCSSCLANEQRLIHSYDYKPSPIYSKMAWENTRYLGVELEIEATEQTKDALANKTRVYLKQITKPEGKKLHKLVYLKNDGSLTHGFEIVTHPFTLKSFHKHFPIKEFLKFLKDNDAKTSDHCGMHVHVSKEKLRNQSLLNGKWFFYKCKPFLMTFSERKSFRYCEFEPEKPNRDPYYQPLGRRTAFNVAGSVKTLELRLFQGTLNYVQFMANMQFSDCFVDYIQNVGGTFLQKNSAVLIWRNFLEYANRAKEYQTMLKYIEGKNLCV